MKVYRYPIIAIITSMYKTVFNFQLKKINTKSAFMSSWWSGYFYHEWLFIDDMIWITGGRWHMCYTPAMLNENWHILTWQKQQNICVNSESGLIFVWKKEESDYCYERSNMYMYERMKTIQLLIFFSAKN